MPCGSGLHGLALISRTVQRRHAEHPGCAGADGWRLPKAGSRRAPTRRIADGTIPDGGSVEQLGHDSRTPAFASGCGRPTARWHFERCRIGSGLQEKSDGRRARFIPGTMADGEVRSWLAHNLTLIRRLGVLVVLGVVTSCDHPVDSETGAPDDAERGRVLLSFSSLVSGMTGTIYIRSGSARCSPDRFVAQELSEADKQA